MALVLAHPFRFAGPAAALVDDASDAGIAQELALLVTTRRGEREMSPAWGVSDPVFDGIDVAEVNAALALYGPAGVEVVAGEVDWPETTSERVQLHFRRTDT